MHMTFLQYIILFVTVLAGGIVAFRFKSNNRRALQLVLSFVGAYLLGIIVLHLIPDAYSEHDNMIGLWVLGGFFIQIALERLSLGVEHGHIHDHHHANRPMFAVQVMLGLSVHAFIEGLPLSIDAVFHAHEGDHAHNPNAFFYGVIMHKAPEAFALTLLLLMSHFEKKWVWLCLIVFAMMSPLGAFITQVIHFEVDTFRKIIAFVVGSLLHISTTILFEIDNTDEHSISWQKIGAIVGGVCIALLTIL
jgi:zinc transporter ZupT